MKASKRCFTKAVYEPIILAKRNRLRQTYLPKATNLPSIRKYSLSYSRERSPKTEIGWLFGEKPSLCYRLHEDLLLPGSLQSTFEYSLWVCEAYAHDKPR